MSSDHDALEIGHQWTEQDLTAKLGGGPFALASSLEWHKSLAFLRNLGTVENFQHSVWGLAENNSIEDRETCGAIESYLRAVPSGVSSWSDQLRTEQLNLHKFSPLAKFICNHRYNTATMLMDAGLDPNFPCDSSGRTAIQACILAGTLNIDGLKLLLSYGANPQGERDEKLCHPNVAVCKERPLFCIWKRILPSDSKSLHLQELLFDELITSNVSINELDPAGNNIAHVLCTVGSSTSVSDLLAMRGDEAKPLFGVSRATDGFLPIHIACSFGHASLIPILMAVGARPSARIDNSVVKDKDAYSCSDLGISTCFYLALISGKSSCTALTIFKKLDTKLVAACVHSASGTTPLHWCVWHHVKSMNDTTDQMNLINALISNGCSVEKRDRAGRLPIHLACAGGHHSLIQVFAPSDSIINDRLAMSSRFLIKATSKILRLRTLVKKSALDCNPPLVELNCKSKSIAGDAGPNDGCIENVAAVSSADLASESIVDDIDGVTPLILSVMSRNPLCVKAVLAVPGVVKFQFSAEPRASVTSLFAPVPPFSTHFITVANACSDKKFKTEMDVLSRFKCIDQTSAISATEITLKDEIHSPLSFAMVIAEYAIVDVIIQSFSENETILISEMIRSKYRCKDDFFLLLLSSIVKSAKVSELPQQFRVLLPMLEDLISKQLENIPNPSAHDDGCTTSAKIDDDHANCMLLCLSRMKNLPSTSEGMPALVGHATFSDKSNLGCIHMACILGYSLCCETVMKTSPLQNYSLCLQSGLISPLHLCILYKRSACFQILIKLTASNHLSFCIQEPLLNTLLPIHIAVLSGTLDVVMDLCLTFNSLNISNQDFASCQPGFLFQLIATAGSGYDLESTNAHMTSKFSCVALNFDISDAIYSNHLTVAYKGGPIIPFLNEFERSKNHTFTKLHMSCIDCIVICTLYGLTSHCRYLLSRTLPSNNRKAMGYFVDNFGSWIPMNVSLIHDWTHMNETAAWTPLNVAVHRGHRDILELLLSYGHDCNTRCPLGWTPLTLACFNGDAQLVNLLLVHRAITSRPDAAGWTPVMVCVTKLGFRRIRYSIEVTGEWSIEDARDRLSNSLSKGLTDESDAGHLRAAVVYAMFEQPINPSVVTKDSNMSILNSLLMQCNTSDDFSPKGWSALYTAIYLQQLTVASTLISAQANVNVGCTDGRQPLFAACSIPHVPLVLHLLKLGADPCPETPHSHSKMTLQTLSSKEEAGPASPQYHCLPIVSACKMGSMSTVLALLAACYSSSKFPNIEVVNAAVSACIESISMHIIGMLLVHPVTRKHASGSIAESFHKTCLLSLMLWAGDTCQLWALQAALASGGDVNGTKNGTSALHIVCSRSRSFKIAVYLVEQVLCTLSCHVIGCHHALLNFPREPICISETRFQEHPMKYQHDCAIMFINIIML
jgi:ankyrin repeat protein